mgnify:FL=1
MRRLINRLWLLPLLLLPLMVCTSCSDDDDAESASHSGILGGWFMDWSTSDKVILDEITFNGDGTFEYCNIISSIKAGMNSKEAGTSTYSYDGKVLKCLYNWSTGSSTQKHKVDYLDKYTCTLENEANGVVETSSRIVDTYYLNVGDVTNFVYEDPEFSATSYASSDSRIVLVSETGEISALKRGTTYITARADVGAVTIKIIVSDRKYATDEYGDDLTLSKREIEKKYGKNYLDLPALNGWLYYPGYVDINEVMFVFDKNGKVKKVTAQYWTDIDLNKITQSFENKYERVGVEDEGFNAFVVYGDKCNYYAYTDVKTSSVGYEKIESDFEKYDGCASSTADEIAKLLGYELTEEDDGLISVRLYDGDMYEKAQVLYDTETLTPKLVVFTCKEGVTQQEALDLVKANYPAFVEGMGYCEREDWWNMSKAIFVTVGTDKKGHTQVKYVRF